MASKLRTNSASVQQNQLLIQLGEIDTGFITLVWRSLKGLGNAFVNSNAGTKSTSTVLPPGITIFSVHAGPLFLWFNWSVEGINQSVSTKKKGLSDQFYKIGIQRILTLKTAGSWKSNIEVNCSWPMPFTSALLLAFATALLVAFTCVLLRAFIWASLRT